MNAQMPLFAKDEKWLKFHQDNPAVWKAFEALTFKMISAGRKTYSAGTIIGVVRFRIDETTTDDEFKINNHHIAWYARLFMEVHPQHEGFFKIRKLKYE